MYDRTKELLIGIFSVIVTVATYGVFVALSVRTTEDGVGSTVQDALFSSVTDLVVLLFVGLPLVTFFISSYINRRYPNSSLKRLEYSCIVPILVLAFGYLRGVTCEDVEDGMWCNLEAMYFSFFVANLILIFLGMLAVLRRISTQRVLAILAAGALFLLWGAWDIVDMSNENRSLRESFVALDAQVAQLRSADDESLDGILVNSASICDGFPNTGRSSYWTARCWSSVARQLTDETDLCTYSQEDFSKAVCVQVLQDQGGY
jgi:hypothetical protein